MCGKRERRNSRELLARQAPREVRRSENLEPLSFAHRSRRVTYYFFCLARASAIAIAIVPVGCGWRSGACWGSRRTPVTRIAGYS